MPGRLLTDLYELNMAVNYRQVALAVPRPYRAPTDPAAPLLARRPLGGEVLAVVLADGRIAGMVTLTLSDLRQAVRWRTLAAGPPPTHKPAPPGAWAASLARELAAAAVQG